VLHKNNNHQAVNEPNQTAVMFEVKKKTEKNYVYKIRNQRNTGMCGSAYYDEISPMSGFVCDNN